MKNMKMDTKDDILATTDKGDTIKMEIDYTDQVDKILPEAENVADSGKLIEAIDMLIVVEKQTRTGGDMISTGRILVKIAQLCKKQKNWTVLNENINALARRRGQLKQAVVKLVQECMTYIDDLPTKDLKYELIDTLRSVTEGKIFVECERARLTYKLTKMREEEGDILKAADILQELQIETYGSMEKREKVELILEQMRLCLAKKDYIRTQIISKKINVRFFEDESTQELKIKFYNLMIQLDQHDSSYLKIYRHLRAILTTPSIKDNVETKKELLRAAVLYLILSSYDNEQSDLLHRMLEDKLMDSIPDYKSLLDQFKTQELINWKHLCAKHEANLKHPQAKVFDNSELGNKRWAHLKDRVVEHNIRIMAKYYTRVSLLRMSQLLDLTQEEVETFLCDMVVSGKIQGKTDRVEGIVSFQTTKDPSELLNDWSHNLNTLMNLIAKTTHLINKEEMVHKHLLVSKTTQPQASSSTSKISEKSSKEEVTSTATPMEVEG